LAQPEAAAAAFNAVLSVCLLKKFNDDIVNCLVAGLAIVTRTEPFHPV
jgi:hypothetical protein